MGGEEALYHCCMSQQPEAEATKDGGQDIMNKEALGEGHYSIHSSGLPIPPPPPAFLLHGTQNSFLLKPYPDILMNEILPNLCLSLDFQTFSSTPSLWICHKITHSLLRKFPSDTDLLTAPKCALYSSTF